MTASNADLSDVVLSDQLFLLNLRSRPTDQDISDDFLAATGRALIVPDVDDEADLQRAMREWEAITPAELRAYHAYLVQRELDQGRKLPW